MLPHAPIQSSPMWISWGGGEGTYSILATTIYFEYLGFLLCSESIDQENALDAT